jgi:hypothetical protein
MATAVTQIYDETAWTKALWPDWKLAQDVNVLDPTDLDPGLLAAFPDLTEDDIVTHSLNGPVYAARRADADR